MNRLTLPIHWLKNLLEFNGKGNLLLKQYFRDVVNNLKKKKGKINSYRIIIIPLPFKSWLFGLHVFFAFFRK